MGSDNPKAIWHELGTNYIPPRPFLTIAAMRKEREIHEMMARAVYGAMVHGGPHYREFMEMLRVFKHAYHAAKELFEELGDEGDQ